MVKTNIQTFPGEVEILSNLHVGSYLTANGAASNVLEITGNVGATFFIGDGGFLSNIATTLNDITNQGNVISNVVIFEANTHYGGVGLVTSSNVGIQNTNPIHTLDIGDKVVFDDSAVESSGQSVIRVDGRINATRFEGDGGLLSNIATTLSSIVNQGNVASNCIILEANAHYNGVGLVTSSNVGIQNSNPTFDLSVGSNLHVDDTGANVLTVHGNVTTNNLNLGVFSITPAYGLNDVCSTSNGTSNVVQFQNSNTSIVTTSNINVGGQVIITGATKGLDVTSNIELGGRLKFDSNVFIDTLRVADVAANLVTYDRVTGELTDSGGTFLNKFAIVSEQPPSDLFANATTVANHGGYTLTTSNLATNSNTFNAFDGTANAWTGGTGMYVGGSNVLIESNLTQLSNLHPTQRGDWLAIEFPYKTTLRHMKLTPATVWQSFPYAANLYATNNDLTWTEIKYWDGLNPGSASNVQTITVNATEQFKKYALVTTKLVPNTNIASAVSLQDWQLFTESFSIDGGKVAMAQQPTTGGETTMNQHGPHSRGEPIELKRYPEVYFSDAFSDRAEIQNVTTSAQGPSTFFKSGYSITTSSYSTDGGNEYGYHAFDGRPETFWKDVNDYDTATGLYDYGYTGIQHTLTDVNNNTYDGNYIIMGSPKNLKIAHVNVINKVNYTRRVRDFTILGSNSNDLTGWTLLKNGSFINSAFNKAIIDSPTHYFKYHAFLVRSIEPGAQRFMINSIDFYGYEEELRPNGNLGDTSVDTTFTSIMNTPSTGGANVYVDGKLGETFTNRVIGPTPTETSTTYNSDGKYWKLTGALESNVTIEANTFLEGDHPHAVSVWFNSSNLEANVSNSCIFSVGTDERFDYKTQGGYQLLSNTYQAHLHKITASDGTTDDYFGHGNSQGEGVSMSGDGSVLVVGAYADDDSTSERGSAYIFVKSDNGSWIEVQKLLSNPTITTGSPRFGWSVSISKDANYIAVGAFLNDTGGSNRGAAYIFKRQPDSNRWTQMSYLQGLANEQRFGSSVSLSSDGSFLAVGAINDTSARGAAYVFKQTGNDGSSWDSGQKLTASDISTSAQFGGTLHISGDTNYLAVGAWLEDGGATDSGAVYVFHRNGVNGANEWDTNHFKLERQGSNETGNNRYGSAVSLSEDATYIGVGAYGTPHFGTTYDGNAYVYKRSGTNTWGTETELVRIDPDSDEHFGLSISMSYDGTHLVVGAPYYDFTKSTDVNLNAEGAVYVYKRSGDNWTRISRLHAFDSQSDSDRFGGAVTISQDGQYLASSCYLDDDEGTNSGSVYIFTRDYYGTPASVPYLNLIPNTWHNLTYAYEGHGGSKVTYLDGRKICEEKAEDSFQEYPPGGMHNNGHYGYVATASGVFSGATVADYQPFRAFNKILGGSDFFLSEGQDNRGIDYYNDGSGGYTRTPPATLGVLASTGTQINEGEWLKIEFPYKLVVDHIKQTSQGDRPKILKWYGSNDDHTWTELLEKNQYANSSGEATLYPTLRAGFRFFAMVVSAVYTTSHQYWRIDNCKFYGHKENDLVRLPDPTNVLKYPHIAMTGPAQRGYVVSASDITSDAPEWYAFDGVSSTRWRGSGGQYTNGDANNTVQLSSSSSTPNGSWIKVEFPHKLKINKMRISGATTQSPKDGELWASNNDSDWTQIFTFSNMANGSAGNFTDFNFTPLSSDYFKYFALIVTKTGATNETLTSIYELEYYGTEEGSVPIQIGGGNIDKVANFRVYDKFIGEDQALEIWDAQKDEFGRAKSSMTLQKGRLGIGTTEPEGRLAVLDEPYSKIQQFPPGYMYYYNDHIDGHGEFTASTSSDNNGSDPGWHAFSDRVNDGTQRWRSGNGRYRTHGDLATYIPSPYNSNQTTYPQAITQLADNTPHGEWIKLKMPYRGIMKSYRFNGFHNHTPESGELWGSNDNNNWTHLHSFSGAKDPNILELAGRRGNDHIKWNTYSLINNTKAYSYYALIVTKTVGHEACSIKALQYYGVRDQEQSVLDDGQLTLTKNLVVPRIGPKLTEYPVPRKDAMILEYNTALPIHGERPIDTSGNSNDGTYSGSKYDIGVHALYFPGNTYLSATNLNTQAGDWVHSVSLWFKMGDKNGVQVTTSTTDYLFHIGDQVNHGGSALQIQSDKLMWDFFNDDVDVVGANFENYKWYHVVLTYEGGSVNSGGRSRRIYVNGVNQPLSHSGSQNNLNLAANEGMHLGALRSSTSGYFPGYISDFRVWSNAVLTPEEALSLYKRGRVPPQHHLHLAESTMTIGSQEKNRLPNSDAQLVVAGHIRAGTGVLHSFTGQHMCVPDEPMEKGLIVSAKKNKFVKLNGPLDTGKSAITIDESLPIVSLSNVAQDKACFGVVSKIEESNTINRKQTFGGFITSKRKVLGDNRAIVNSVGEGAIWVVDTNGPLESGDYITTSNVVGYGQKQDDDILHNYTVAKITMDCDFTGSNVTVQTIKREETGLQTIMEDTWNQLADYDRSSNTETQYSNTLAPSAYSGQSGYTPREVTTIVDYTDGSNIVSIAEWSNLESNIQNTYQSNTFTEIVDYTKFVNLSEWSNLTTDVQNTYSEAEITTYYQIQRGENVLDENGQLQFEDKTGATEAPYERRFLDASGAQTDSANAVHIAAFVGCTYHCG
jgi:hypothetical protein